MKPIRSCIVAMLIVMSTPSLASEISFTSTLKFVYPLANGDFVLGFDADPASCTAAGSPKYVYVAVGQNGMTAAGSAKLFAGAMTALVTRQSVSIAFDDTTNYCYVNRLTVSN
jgi:hypothetical protein